MTDQLKTVLTLFAPFNENELSRILSCFKPKSVSKNTLLLTEGDTCKEFFFIQKGSLRIFFMDKYGHEKTRYIMLDNHIGTALTSFIAQKPSLECMDALEDTEYWSITHADFYRLNTEMEHWKMFYQRILEMAYSFQNKKIEQLVTLTAKQRYEGVLTENPLYMQRLSNKILASYLDMREETLSRLKSK